MNLRNQNRSPMRSPCHLLHSGSLLAVAMLALTGCGDGINRLPVVAVQGRLTVDGRPAPGAMVALHPLDGPALENRVHPVGRVGEDGTLQLTTYKAGDGAPEGNYAVTVQWRKLEVPPKAASGDDEPRLGPNLLDPQVAKAATTPLKVSITAGATELPAIELASTSKTVARRTARYDE